MNERFSGVRRGLALFLLLLFVMGVAPVGATGGSALSEMNMASELLADFWADWTAKSDQPYAEFGRSVDTAGDVNGDGYTDVIVGANEYYNGQSGEGRAFVFHGSARGLSPTPNWTAENNQADSRFGRSVSMAGDVNGDGYDDVIIADAPYFGDEGRAYVYHGSAAGLSATPNWTAESDQTETSFTVGPAGDVNGDGYADVILGASGYENGQDDEGRAFVYHGSAAGLSAIPNWMAEGNQVNVQFGNSVRTAGDINRDGYADVIVGAPYYTSGHYTEGRAFVYHGSAAGLSASPNWMAEGNQQNAYFGSAVSTAGDVNGDGYDDVIVGADNYDTIILDEGRVFVYHGSALGLNLTPNWTVEGDQPSDEFGAAVSTAGDVNSDGYDDVVIGAWSYDNEFSAAGRAFAYHGSAAGLSAVSNWTAEGTQDSDYFGFSLGTAGDVNGDSYDDVIVGAFQFHGSPPGGRAFAYHGSVVGLSLTVDSVAPGIAYDGWQGVADLQASGGSYRAASAAGQHVNHRSTLPETTEARWTAESNQGGAYFGTSVGAAGDVNGDGYVDVIVGAPNYDVGQWDEGRAYVFHGSATGLSLTPNWTAEGDQGSASFGHAVGTAGDVNGDGYDDVIVGANEYNNNQGDGGRAFVYYGSAAGLSDTPNWMAGSNQAEAYFGVAVGTAGDVNGDGYADVIVGANAYDNSPMGEGSAFVYYGSAAGLNLTPDWTAEGNQIWANFGISVGTAGDVNSDGYGDVIVGAHTYDNGQTNEGWAFVYHGSAAGLSTSPNWTAESNQDYAYFGYRVGTAGDVNGDGYGDVIVGAPDYFNGQVSEGRAYVYHGSAAGLSQQANWRAESNQDYADFGRAAGTAGDVNGDGYSDVVVGAPYFDNDQDSEGRAFVFYGSALGLSLTPAWNLEAHQSGGEFGNAVGAAGDVNGDSYSDVLVGASSYSNDQLSEGKAFVYHGAAGGLEFRTSVTLIAYRGPDQGLARVTIDGVSQGVLDLYAPAPEYLYRANYADLSLRRHNIIVEALGQKNPASSGTEVRVDGFEVEEVITEDDRPEMRYSSWAGLEVAEAYGGSVRQSDRQAASITFTFTGSQFTWVTARGPQMGLAEVWVDDALAATVDLYNPTLEWQVPQVTGGLANTTHLVEIRVLGTHNPASTGNTVVFDAYRVP